MRRRSWGHEGRRMGFLSLLFLAVTMFGGAGAEAEEQRVITLASTTSTQNSGLFKHILPLFKKATGITVRVVAVGTGAAIRLAKAGDADVLLVHHKPSEEAFVSERYGVERYPVMVNDFVIVGPSDDPAGIDEAADAASAFRRVADARAVFLSRGDESGTHKREKAVWAASGANPEAASGTWYRKTGSGMGATLNIAAAMNGYTLTDRGTWLSFVNKRDLKLLHAGDPGLLNEYGVILVSPERHPHVDAAAGEVFIDWLRSRPGRAAIESLTIGGQRLFSAHDPARD